MVLLPGRSRATVCGIALSVVAVLSGTSVAQAESGKPDREKILEINMTNTPDFKEGQPAVAINPKNPKNLVFTSTIFLPHPGLYPTGECFLAHSQDQGQTWTRVPWPLGDRPQCGEPNVAVDAKGTFYILNNQVGPDSTANETNSVVVSRSLDGGRTWSGPVKTPLVLSGAPKLRVDAATGKVYAVGGLEWQYPSAVSVSADRGQTWGPSRVIPGPRPCVVVSPQRPPACGYPGRQLAVHDGILVSASQESIVTLHVSRDDGQTWTDLPVTDGKGTPVPAGSGPLLPVPQQRGAADPIPWVSADPSQSGRFAVMVPREANLEVYVTKDAGKTWTGPAVIAAPDAQRPWMDFGPKGYLGVMWRTTAVDAFSVVSFDHGRSFSAPVKVNRETVPAAHAGPPGDRWSWIALDDKYAYVTWSDGRDNDLTELDAIFSRVPLSLYRKPGR